MKNKKLLIIAILSTIAILNAWYLTYQAYQLISWVTTSWFCDLNNFASCTNVLASPYSRIFGIPIPAIALVVYPLILLISLLWYYWKIRKPFHILLGMSIWWIIMSAYFIYQEVFNIWALCLLCLMCSVIICSIFIISIMWIYEKKWYSKIH